jgi:hypothetical protein
LFHGFDTLGSPLEGRRVPWLRRETCTLASHERTLIQLLTVNSRLWSWVATLHRLLSTTSSCFSCHYAARTRSRSATGSIKPSLLVSPLLGGPARLRPFAPILHLHQRKSSHNLHLQYLAKSQSTPHCQSLFTPGSDHPLALGCSGPQSPRWWVHWQHT